MKREHKVAGKSVMFANLTLVLLLVISITLTGCNTLSVRVSITQPEVWKRIAEQVSESGLTFAPNNVFLIEYDRVPNSNGGEAVHFALVGVAIHNRQGRYAKYVTSILEGNSEAILDAAVYQGHRWFIVPTRSEKNVSYTAPFVPMIQSTELGHHINVKIKRNSSGEPTGRIIVSCFIAKFSSLGGVLLPRQEDEYELSVTPLRMQYLLNK